MSASASLKLYRPPPRVFITNDGGLDFSGAERFGALVKCTTGKINVFSPDKLADEMMLALAVFTEQDFLLLVGGAMSMFFAGVCLPDNIQRLQLLVYDAKGQDYFVRTIRI